MISEFMWGIAGKLSLAKWIVIFVSAFFPKLPDQEPKYPPDWIVLGILFLLSFIFVWLVVRNNSCGNSSSSKFFLVNLNIVTVLFFV